MKNDNKTILLFILFIVTYFLSAFLIRLILGHLDNHFMYKAINNNPGFWFSSYGLTIKISINIFFTFLVIKIGLLFYHVPVKSRTILYNIVLCANIFLIQLWCEFAQNKAISYFNLNTKYANFLFLSINQFLIFLTGHHFKSFEYAFDTINAFEILFWLLMIKVLAKELQIPLRKAGSIVALFYMVPLLFFITIITLITLLSA